MIGQTISHFKILEKLGEGGMCVVYRAEDLKLGRTVALKFLPSDLSLDQDVKGRFIHEAQAASALDHPNICPVYDVGETADGQMYIVMACYDGKTLKQKMGGGALARNEAVVIASQIAEGLQEAHSHGIVHRDVKPANILLSGTGVVKIVDFGLAKVSGATRLTKSGTTLGTVAYMAPEQLRGSEVDARADIFSLGVVLYEMLTGILPFRGDHEAALMYSILHEEPPALREFFLASPELQHIVSKALEKNPHERYQSLEEFLSDLRRLRDSAADSHAKNRFARILAGAVILVLASAVYFLVSRNPSASPPEPGVIPDTAQTMRADTVSEARTPPVLPDRAVALPPSVAVKPEPADSQAETKDQPAIDVPLTENRDTVEEEPTPKNPEPGDVMTNSIGMEFILIPSGVFQMGADDDEAESDERPIRTVTLAHSIWFGRYEVTNGQFASFVSVTNYVTTAERVGWARTWDRSGWTETAGASWRTFFTSDSLPVVCVSWQDAKAFAQWLNEKEGVSQYRLPTEAEWEFAARSGPKQYKFSWGNGIPVARMGGNIADEEFKLMFPSIDTWPGYYDGHVFSAPVGFYLPNEFGLCDMTGNVWEWCEDWYDDYAPGPQTDPVGPPTGSRRVLRGGSWKEIPRYVRAANRTRYEPDYKSADTGFRLVKMEEN